MQTFSECELVKRAVCIDLSTCHTRVTESSVTEGYTPFARDLTQRACTEAVLTGSIRAALIAYLCVPMADEPFARH